MNAIKTLFYMGLMHGFFTYYIPWQIASRDPWIFKTDVFQFLAWPLWITGTLIIIRCSIDIIRRGRGTPAHLDPPQALIVNGLYRHVRNPIYLGALLVQLGTIVWHRSILLLLYFLCFIVAYHILIVLIEEPTLKNKFGASYQEYRRDVPRWLPRFPTSIK